MLNIDGFVVSSTHCGCSPGFCPRDFFRGALQLLLTLWKPKWLEAKGTKSNKHWKDCVAVKRVRLGMNCLTSVFARRSSSAFLSDSARPSLERDWLTRCCPETSCVAIMCVSWLSRVLCTLRCGVICCLLDVHLSCGPVKIAPTFLGGAETEGCLKPPPRLHCLNFNSTVAQIVLAILQWLSPSASAAQRAPMSALQVKSPTVSVPYKDSTVKQSNKNKSQLARTKFQSPHSLLRDHLRFL